MSAPKEPQLGDLSRMAKRLHPIGVSIFSEMSRLALEYDAVNLSQGFPDFEAPSWLKDAARGAISRNLNQYALSQGSQRLREAISGKIEAQYGLRYDPASEVTVTNGATEAIYDVIQALVDPGDEVIVFEPTYDSYVPSIELAGGTPRYLRLEPPDWNYSLAQLDSLFNSSTRVIVVNSPHNPTGKVYSAAELEHIAGLCRKHDVIAVTDEVYEHLVFGSNRHIPIASLPGMRERTVTISSASKTFSVTGWKVGYVAAPPDLTDALRRIHQFVTFCASAPFQDAVAFAIESAERFNYYAELRTAYESRLEKLFGFLREAGLRPLRPQGTFFIMSDIEGLGFDSDLGFARHMISEAGVACIPPSVFYSDPRSAPQLARWCFAKRDETLDAAGAKLKAWSNESDHKSRALTRQR